MVHVDRDHFMDEFFEQVTEPDPQPTTAFFLAPRTPITAGVWKAGSSVLGNRVSEEETCTRPRCSSFPPSRVNVQT